jgi:hypothetical protein
MGSPIKGSDILSTPPGGAVCDTFRAWVTVAGQFKDFLNWLIDASTGEITATAMLPWKKQLIKVYFSQSVTQVGSTYTATFPDFQNTSVVEALYLIKCPADSTGTDQLAVKSGVTSNIVGTLTIQVGGVSPQPGVMSAGKYYLFYSDGTNATNFQLLNPDQPRIIQYVPFTGVYTANATTGIITATPITINLPGGAKNWKRFRLQGLTEYANANNAGQSVGTFGLAAVGGAFTPVSGGAGNSGQAFIGGGGASWNRWDYEMPCPNSLIAAASLDVQFQINLTATSGGSLVHFYQFWGTAEAQ